jgi:methionyl aminopeptidase
MKIPLKTDKEIAIMRVGGQKLAKIMTRLLKEVKPGVALISIDQLADRLIVEEGGQASFKMVRDYRWATCINLNSGVVHGIPDGTIIKAGDLVSIDIGIYYRGFNTDMSWSKSADEPVTTTGKFLRAGEETLKLAIDQLKPGHHVSDISKVIQTNLNRFGYSPVKELTGHGVGRKLHEEPMIPGFAPKNIGPTPLLVPGMVLAIEIIYAMGSPQVFLEEDGWTIGTADGSLSGLFEKTVAITETGPYVLTD